MKKLRKFLLVCLTITILIVPALYTILDAYSDYVPVKYKIAKNVERVINQKRPKVYWLSAKNNYLINEKSEKVLLRGVNVGSINWGTDEWNPKAVTYAITQWHANVIRTRVFQDEFETNPQAFFEKLEWQILDPARKQGVYVILHPWIHDNQAMPDEGTIRMWVALAQRYANDPIVLYDVLSEPRGVDFEQMKRAYVGIIEAIRKVHPKSLIFVSGLGWGRDINAWVNDPLPHANIVYRSNPYNKSGEFESLFGDIAAFYPVFLGEFGSGGYPPMSEQSVSDLIAYAQNLGIGWTAWNFSSQGCPCLLSDEPKFIPSSFGAIVKSALAQNPRPQFPINNAPKTDSDRYYIYSQYLENGFLDYSWESDVNLQKIDQQAGGKKYLEVTIKPTGALSVQSSRSVNLNEYRNLVVSLSSNMLGKVNIRLKTETDNLSKELKSYDYSDTAEITSDTITTIRIPVSDFELQQEDQIITLMIGNATPDLLESVRIDAVYFER